MECISIESELAPHKDVCCVMHFFLINITVKRGHSTNGIIFISLKCPKKKKPSLSPRLVNIVACSLKEQKVRADFLFNLQIQ